MWTLRRYGEFIVEADHIDEPRLKRIEETLGQPIEYAHRVLQRMLDAGMSEEQVVRALRTITDRKILALNSKVNLLGAHMQVPSSLFTLFLSQFFSKLFSHCFVNLVSLSLIER